MKQKQKTDRRTQKTIKALNDAFFEIVLSRSYEEISVALITDRANVGRSTFYQHYPNKDALLAASMHYPLSVLADCVNTDTKDEDIHWITSHFWNNRKFAPRIFSGTARSIVVATLQSKISERLKVLTNASNTTKASQVKIIAHQIAEAQLSILTDWLLAKNRCSPEWISQHIKASSLALKDLCLASS